MCRAVTCKKCGKTTWAGCGQHVDQVLAGVPRADRCAGHPHERRLRLLQPPLRGQGMNLDRAVLLLAGTIGREISTFAQVSTGQSSQYYDI